MGRRVSGGVGGEGTVELPLCITFRVKGSDTRSVLRPPDNEKKTDTGIYSPDVPRIRVHSFLTHKNVKSLIVRNFNSSVNYTC